MLGPETLEMHLSSYLRGWQTPESKRCQEDLDKSNPSTELVAFDTLLQDESLSEDVREIMRIKYE